MWGGYDSGKGIGDLEDNIDVKDRHEEQQMTFEELLKS